MCVILALAACGTRIEPDRTRQGDDLGAVLHPYSEGFDPQISFDN
jgi:hypothetical protein